jgi:small redox-active disulfide protein 2
MLGGSVEILVLGTGCAKCNELYDLARRAAERAGVGGEAVGKIEDVDTILAHGVMMTPALVVDGEVKSTGRLPDEEQVVAWIAEAGGR